MGRGKLSITTAEAALQDGMSWSSFCDTFNPKGPQGPKGGKDEESAIVNGRGPGHFDDPGTLKVKGRTHLRCRGLSPMLRVGAAARMASRLHFHSQHCLSSGSAQSPSPIIHASEALLEMALSPSAGDSPRGQELVTRFSRLGSRDAMEARRGASLTDMEIDPQGEGSLGSKAGLMGGVIWVSALIILTYLTDGRGASACFITDAWIGTFIRGSTAAPNEQPGKHFTGPREFEVQLQRCLSIEAPQKSPASSQILLHEG
ncbi:hypothetical protein JHW43_004189 [Diplocarpon mali]|nr:hypothetical protein JHW43_004189 [Diplocarpon mali]